jgi:hypothetical protein
MVMGILLQVNLNDAAGATGICAGLILFMSFITYID